MRHFMQGFIHALLTPRAMIYRIGVNPACLNPANKPLPSGPIWMIFAGDCHKGESAPSAIVLSLLISTRTATSVLCMWPLFSPGAESKSVYGCSYFMAFAVFRKAPCVRCLPFLWFWGVAVFQSMPSLLRIAYPPVTCLYCLAYPCRCQSEFLAVLFRNA